MSVLRRRQSFIKRLHRAGLVVEMEANNWWKVIGPNSTVMLPFTPEGAPTPETWTLLARVGITPALINDMQEDDHA